MPRTSQPNLPPTPAPQRSPHPAGNSQRGVRALCLIAVVFGVVLVIISVSQMFRPLNAPDFADAECGNVFTSNDDWTYRSTYSPDIDFGDYLSRGQDLMTDKVQELMDDAEIGAEAYDKCRDLHGDQWIIIGLTGVPGLILLLGGGFVLFRTRSRTQSAEPPVETWGSAHGTDTAR